MTLEEIRTVLEALSLASERVTELSGWCKLPASGGTLQAITNYTTGKSVMFDGLTLQTGEWINLSFDPLNLKFQGGWSGRGNLMRYVVAGSDYGDFYLSPGANYLSVFMTDTTAVSGATIAWTPLFWGLDGALL